MASIPIRVLPEAGRAAEPWPADEVTVRADEMFARRLDTEFSAGVRDLLHKPETGLSSLSGEAALEAIAGVYPALEELRQRTLDGATGPRQRGLLEPLINARLDWAAGTIGRLAERATAQVDDQSVAERLTGLGQDAAASWDDPAHLQKLGRTAVNELRWQGERRGWDETEIHPRARAGLSDLYGGAIEAAMERDLDGAAGLLAHAREVMDPARLETIGRRLARAREDGFLRKVDAALSAMPLDPATPPTLDAFSAHTAELTPDDATERMRARLDDLAAHAQRRAERQWNRQQAEAGIVALDWLKQNPDASSLFLPEEVQAWLASDQFDGLKTLEQRGRLVTDPDVFWRLDHLSVYEPAAFAALDLDRHRLSLDDGDHARFATAQKAIADGATDPAFARHRQARISVDRTLERGGIDTDSAEAAGVRADVREQLDSFDAIEGRSPNGVDIDGIVHEAVNGNFAAESPLQAIAEREVSDGDIELPLSEFDTARQPQEPTDQPYGEGRLPSVEPTSTQVVRADLSVDPSSSPFAEDPNVIRVAGGNNSARRGGGRPLSPAQARSENFQSAINAIRALEPNNRELTQIAPPGWVPGERDVARVREELGRAQSRAAGETSAIPIGPYASESIPARGAQRNFTSEERREVDRMGNQHGCHTCGTMTPGSKLGHWVPDHQAPSALSRPGATQRLYPQCLSCSYQQGGEVTQQRRQGGGQQ